MAQAVPQISFGPRFHPSTAPVTFWLVVASVVGWVLGVFSPAVPALLALDTQAWLERPWTLVTYPLVSVGAPLGPLLLCWVTWWVGAEVERWWGSRVQAGFLLTVVVATGLLLWGAGHLLGTAVGDATLATPFVALLVIYALRNPRRTVLLLVLPLPVAALAALAAVNQWYRFGPWAGLAGLLGGVGLPAAYYYWGHHFHRLLARRPGRRAGRRSAGHLRDADTL